MTDYERYCRHFFDATGIHTSLLKENTAIYSSIGSILNISTQNQWPLHISEQNPWFCSLPPHALYGIVRIAETDYCMVLGPVFNVEVTDSLLAQLAGVMEINKENWEALKQTLNASPLMNSLQLARFLSLAHFSLNHEDVPYERLYSNATILKPDDQDIKKRVDKLESGELHNAYYFEVGMYQKVREGSPAQLTHFFQENAHVQMREGKMADDPLRHAKNVFLFTLSRTGFIGAIPGGLDVEKTYQLMDYYSREVERLTSVEAVNNLQYAMIMDFCHRAGASKRPDIISSDVWHCMNYIRSHVYDSITVEDVANDVHRSTSYVMKRFRAELDTHVTAYITKCKLEEAQTLLIYSDKTLAEISHDLCFSTQSYFQNLFKKQFGITPAQFRRQARTI